MSRKNKTDLELFDPSDVTWEVLPSKRRDEVLLRLKCTEGTMNVMKTYSSLLMIIEKMELELGIISECSDTVH